jgi:hypothetical protein
VLAGLDPHVGSEADFFADRVKYYDQGVIDREKIRNDLQDYAASWPERRFWFAGNITIEAQHRKRVRVTFPLRYELRNGGTYSRPAQSTKHLFWNRSATISKSSRSANAKPSRGANGGPCFVITL